MFCSTCATPLDPAQKFCPTCGQPAPGQAAPPQVAQPPQQAVAAIRARPDSVRLASNLLIAAIALSIFGTLYGWVLVGVARIFRAPFLMLSPILIVVWIVLIMAMLQRKNWARIGIAIGIGWSAISLLTSLRFLGHAGVQYMTFIVPWLSFALRAYAGYLLFKPESSTWFADHRTR